jgi:type I restriction enzyme, S subunit
MNAAWKMRSLGDVCRIVGGGTPPKDRAAYYSGSIPWATVRDMRTDLITATEYKITQDAVRCSATNIVPAGNVVIASRVGLGKICIVAQDTAINQDLRGIIPINRDVLIERYLFWWLKSVAHLIRKAGTGATVQGVKLPFLRALRIPIPSVLEQRRIVDILDESSKAIDVAKATIAMNLRHVEAVFQSHLEAIFVVAIPFVDTRVRGTVCGARVTRLPTRARNRPC